MVVCAVAAIALAYTNRLTEPLIRGRVAEETQQALRELLPDADQFAEAPELFSRITAQFPEIQKVYVARTKGKVSGVAFLVTTTGYGGPVTTLVGLDEGGTVRGIKVVSAAKETPGLGTQVMEDWFQRQFENIPLDAQLSLVKGPPKRAGEVQAITSATISSRAVVEGVRTCREAFRALMGR